MFFNAWCCPVYCQAKIWTPDQQPEESDGWDKAVRKRGDGGGGGKSNWQMTNAKQEATWSKIMRWFVHRRSQLEDNLSICMDAGSKRGRWWCALPPSHARRLPVFMCPEGLVYSFIFTIKVIHNGTSVSGDTDWTTNPSIHTFHSFPLLLLPLTLHSCSFSFQIFILIIPLVCHLLVMFFIFKLKIDKKARTGVNSSMNYKMHSTLFCL